MRELQIDHLMNKVDSPQAAGDWFERCGFTVTPLSVIGSMGLCNRLVLFEPAVSGTANFIELMGTLPGAHVQATMQDLLAGGDGTRSMVLVADDADQARARLVQRGFSPGEVHRVSRQWALPGETLDLAFDVLLPMPAPLGFNVCRYHTLQHYLRPQWTHHANGVQRVVAVTGVVEALAPAAAFYERLFAVPADTGVPGAAVLRPGAVALELLTPGAYAERFGRARSPGFAGYTLACQDADSTGRWFERGGAPVDSASAGPWVQAFGNHILLVTASG